MKYQITESMTRDEAEAYFDKYQIPAIYEKEQEKDWKDIKYIDGLLTQAIENGLSSHVIETAMYSITAKQPKSTKELKDIFQQAFIKWVK